MKRLDEVSNWKAQVDEEHRQTTLDMLITAQIQGLEKLMETNGAYVKSPLAYNMVAGLVDQLKYYTRASFRSGEEMLDREMNAYNPYEPPRFGKP